MANDEQIRGARLRDVAAEAMGRWQVPGMVVGLLHEGRETVVPLGMANLESATPTREETLFQYGSISKIVTATAVMQLVERWRIDLDVPVKTYLPELRLADPEATETVTPRQLLTHMSGFWGDDFTDYGRGDDALAKAIDGLAGIRQVTRPGETWSYCNTGFQVLGRLVERCSGRPCEAALRESVLLPAGMEDTFYFADEAITHPAAAGYNTVGEEGPKVARPYAITRAMNAAGGCIGPIGDLLKFARLHMGQGENGQRVLRNGTRLLMQQPQVKAANMAEHWGLGWMLHQIDGEAAFGHGGSTNGFRASLLVVPSRDFAVACLANGSRGSAANREVEDWALSEYAEVKRVPKPACPPVAAALAEVAGVYQAPGGILTVTASSEGLTVDADIHSAITRQSMLQMTAHAVPVGGDEYRVTDTELAGTTFDFLRNADGSIRFMRNGGRLYEPVPAAG